MKLTKKIISLVLTAAMLMGCAVFAVSAAAVKTTDETMTHYTEKQGFHKKTTKYKYGCKITDNKDKNISVDFNNCGDDEYYFLRVRANKATTDKKPVLTVYYEKDGKKITVSKTRYTVEKSAQLPFKDVRINTGMSKDVTLSNPYYNSYKFKTDQKGIVKISTACLIDTNGNETHSFTGVKEGTVKVSAYVRGTSKKAGSFKVTVGTFPAKVRKEFSPLKLKYNAHGSSGYMAACHVELKDILEDTKKGAKYTVSVDDESVASTINSKTIYSTGKGSTTATIKEKLNGKKTTVATLKISVSKCKMAYVADQNREFYNDGIFGNGDMVEYINVGGKLRMKKTLVDCLINNDLTGSHFKKTLYKITYKSSNKKILTVNSDGVVTGKKLGSANVTYTITFSDKSVHSGDCQISVTDEEFY